MVYNGSGYYHPFLQPFTAEFPDDAFK